MNVEQTVRRVRRAAAMPRTSVAWLVHGLTASGAFLGLLALIAVLDRRPLLAVGWLVAAQVLDGLDGPIARRCCVRTVLPRVDGWTLDLVVDYVTCVVAPALLLHEFVELPHRSSLTLCALVLGTSAIWFSRTDLETEDHWFRGFPATWNLIVPTLLLAGTPAWLNAAVIISLCGLSLTDIKFVHPLRVTVHRAPTMLATIAWLGSTVLLCWTGPDVARTELRVVLVASPLYFVALTAWRRRQDRALEVSLA